MRIGPFWSVSAMAIFHQLTARVVIFALGSFSTSLTTPARVKGLGAVGFMISYTLITSAQTHCFPSRNQPCFFVDLYPTAWLGPFVFIIVVGCPSDISPVTVDHDVLFKLPSLRGGGWPIQLTRSLPCRTTVEIRHPRMGFPFLSQLSATAELFVINLVAHHDP